MSGRGESTWACITSACSRFFHGWGEIFIRPPARSQCVRESPLTRVELRRHCSRGNAISRFLTTVVSSVVITLHPKWKTFLARPTLPRDFCVVERYAYAEYFNVLQCLQAINVPSIFTGICKNCWPSIITVN